MEVIKADTDYAMRLLVHMARDMSGRPLPAKMLAVAQEVPEHFAYKILNRLTASGITSRTMGARGGFALAKEPEQITLLLVAKAIQGPLVTRRCVLNNGACPRQKRCAVSLKLRQLQDEFTASMEKLTLQEIVEGAPPQFRG